MTFTSDFSNLTRCCHPKKKGKGVCNEARYYDKKDSKGQLLPRKQWLFIPLLSRLRSQYNTGQAEEMGTYRSTFDDRKQSTFTDIFDGELYQKYLCKEIKLFRR